MQELFSYRYKWVTDLSRLGRNNAMTAFYSEIFFPDRDVRLIALNDSIDTGKGENEIMAFKSVINEYYAKDISRKIKSAYMAQALKGNFAGAHAPYGYTKSPEDKHKLIIDEEAAAVVRRMFQMAADGMGTHQIARIIADEKIYIPTMYKYFKLGYKSNQFDENFPYDWRTTTVKRILESRVYAGDVVSHKQGTKSFKNQKVVRYPESEWIIVENQHEPLVGRDMFEKVQKLIKLKKKANSTGIINIFHGILKCADCNSNMTYHAYNDRSGRVGGTYLCNKYRHGSAEIQRKTCTAHYIPYVNVYGATLAHLNMLIAANLSPEDIMRKLQSDTDDGASVKTAKKALDKLKHRNGELDRIIRKIVEQNALGEITPATFGKLYSGYQTEQEEVVKKISTLEAGFTADNQDKENARRFAEQLRKYTHMEELTRDIILDLIDKIIVYEATGDHREGTRRQDIEFHHRFIGMLPESVCSL